jgi:cytoskeletal protein CcmA (bactofilin family)
MKKVIAGLLGCFLLVFCTGLPVLASPWEIKGGDQTIGKEQVIEGDLIFSGDHLAIDGTVKGDLIVFAREVTISGQVEGSVLGVAWEKLTDEGTIGRDLRVISSEIVVNGIVNGSLTVGALKIYTDGDSQIGKGILGYFSETKLEGQVTGPVQITSMTSTRIGGKITGDFNTEGASVEWLSPAEITGNVADHGSEPSSTEQLAKVKIGGTYHHFKETTDKQFELIKQFAWVSLIWFLGSLILSLIFYRLFPRTALEMTEPTATKFRRGLVTGLIGLVGFPIVIVILLLTVVGIPIAIILSLFYVMLFLVAGIPINLWFGRLLFKSRPRPILQIILGSLTLALIGSIWPLQLIVQPLVTLLGFGFILGNIRLQYKEPSINLKV